jgi:hypothetical protein
MKLFFSLTLALALTSTICKTEAALLFYEGFDYTTGSAIAGQGGWTTGSTSLTTAGTSLAFSDLVTSGGSASLASGNGNLTINTGLTTPLSGERWVSFVMQQTNGIVTFQQLAFVLGDTAGNQMIQVGTAVSSPNPLFMGTGGSFTFFNGGIQQRFPTGYTASAPAFFALKYDFTAATISMFFNPTPGTAEAELIALGTVSTTSSAQMSLGRIQIVAGNVYSGNVLLDEIRIGTSWADVSPIPEPSVMVLFGLSLVGVVCFRRFRSNRQTQE